MNPQTIPPVISSDPRPYRTDGPFESWQDSTTRPSAIGQRCYTFGTPTNPTIVGTIKEVEGLSLLIEIEGSFREVYVSVSHAALIDSAELLIQAESAGFNDRSLDRPYNNPYGPQCALWDAYRRGYELAER